MTISALAQYVASDDPIGTGPTARDAEIVFLGAESEDRFRLSAFVPLHDMRLASTVLALEEIEKRVNAAFLLTFLDPQRVSFYSDLETPEGLESVVGLESLARELGRNLPLIVTDISLGSLKVTVEGSAEEIARLFEGVKPTHWFKKVSKALAAVCASGVIIVGGAAMAGHQVAVTPSPAKAQQLIKEACGYLPPGSEITLTAGAVQVKVPCSKDF
jgi:hypothetical protein